MWGCVEIKDGVHRDKKKGCAEIKDGVREGGKPNTQKGENIKSGGAGS